MLFRSVREVTEHAGTLFPALAGREVELAGFVWFQGWNDQYGGQDEYAANLEKLIRDVRKDLFAWLDRKGYAFIPSEANMVMIDSKRPGKQTIAALLEHKVAIGRSWPSLPNHVRVTIGTRDEMAKFKTAFERVMAS